jgi:hypothetical protein
MQSSIINGVGTIAFTFIIDPETASLVDGAVRGIYSAAHVSTIVWLSVTSIAGTLIAQLLLVPSAELIALAAHAFRIH